MLYLRKTSIIFLWILYFSGIAFAQSDEDCMMCHEDKELTAERYGKNVSMYVNHSLLLKSAHKKTQCISCHKELKGTEFPHKERLKKVKCSGCHLGYEEQIKNDIHKKLNVNLGNKKPSCKACHKTHNIKKISAIGNKSNELCGKCHEEDVLSIAYHFKSEVNEGCKECHKEINHYEELETSVHSKLECSNCHGYVVNHLENHKDKEDAIPKADCYLCHNKIADEHKESIHGISIASGMFEAAHCWDCHGSHKIVKISSSESLVYSKNLVKTCGKCHDDPIFSEEHYSSVKQPGKMYSTSVHGKLVQMGRMDAASCITCHGVHNIKNRIQPGSTISHINLSKVCSECHKEISEEYEQSIHWIAVKKGVHESPSCNDCHSEHSIHAINTVNKREEIKKMQEETCLSCHQNLLLSARFGINGESAKHYQDSYHGLAVIRGDKEAAMCVDCHGVHKILPKYHKESSIHEDNVVKTCANCHEGASEVFSKSYSHTSKDIDSSKFIENIVETIYFWLIVIVIGGMALHNLLIFFHEIRDRRRKDKNEIKIPRFTKNELIQHFVLLFSFIILAITGFQLKYPDSWWSEGLTNIGLNEVNRQLTHRISAVIMVGLSVWHIVYLIITARGRDVLKGMFLRISDFKHAFQNILYHLNIRKKHPEFGNYSYIEKAEYWALIWGTVVMGITGFILWFPTAVGEWAPLWVIKVSEIVHFYEAILASLAIIVWHWFFVMFRPKEYPLSFTCIDGKMTIANYKEEHKLRYKKLIVEWIELNEGKKTKKQLSHLGKLFINSIEKSGVNTDEFIQNEISKDKDIEIFVRKRKLL